MDITAQLRGLIAASVAQATARREDVWRDGYTAAQVQEVIGPRKSLANLFSLSLHEQIRYPVWQFEPTVLPYVPVILKALSRLNTWTVHSFFTQPHELLDCSPLEALRRGQHQQVLQAAIASNDDY